MIANKWRRFYKHLGAHFSLYLSVLIVVAAPAAALRFPVYFRADDVHYLEWVSTRDNLFLAFVPSEAVLFGMFRPMQNIAWWPLYRLFGLNPFPYQVFVTLVYGFSFVLFFELVELMFSWRVALYSLIAYLVTFFYLGYIVFWFSDLTFVLEMFFINLSLYLFARAFEKRGGFAILGGLVYVCAVLSKEPSIVIVPAVALVYLLSEWKNLTVGRRKFLTIVVGMLMCVGLAWVALNPHLRSRPGIDLSLGTPRIISFVSQRWRFYARQLVSEFGVLIWISTLYLTLKAWSARWCHSVVKSFYIPLALSIVVSLILKQFHSAALSILFVGFVAVLVKRRKESLAVVWCVLSLLGIMTISFRVRTYLVEASFGLAIIVGSVLDDIFNHLRVERQKLPTRLAQAMLPISIAILCIGIVAFLPKVKVKLDVLNVVSASRQNFCDAITFISMHLTERTSHLIVVDYKDMGLAYVQDILSLPDRQKAHRQKTMTSEEIQRMLSVVGVSNINVHSLAWFYDNQETERIYLLAMNKYEHDFLKHLDLEMGLVYGTERGEEGVWLYHVGE